MDIREIFQNITDWLVSSGLRISLMIIGALLVKKIIRIFIDSTIKRVVRVFGNKEAEVQRENTLIGIFNGILSVIIWFIVATFILAEFGVDIGPILAGAGIVGVAVGFGAQALVKDFLAGLFIIVENQYKVGDSVCLNDTCGKVEDITLRKTVLRDSEGKIYHIPHGTISKVSNSSDKK
ncbi:MAG: mechanosensitive ion channel domain-containing protein [Candidatus Paceibacterota bacterium]|jgi:small conductance mechanosensitive channel